MRMLIKNPVNLKSDPRKSKNPKVQELLEIPPAKVLYTLIKQNYYIKKGLASKCLFVWDFFNEGNIEINSYEELRSAMNLFLAGHIIKSKNSSMDHEKKYSEDFAKEVYPYFIGDKELKYFVNGKLVEI